MSNGNKDLCRMGIRTIALLASSRESHLPWNLVAFGMDPTPTTRFSRRLPHAVPLRALRYGTCGDGSRERNADAAVKPERAFGAPDGARHADSAAATGMGASPAQASE